LKFSTLLKKTLALTLAVPIAISAFAGTAAAEKYTTYLAPQYQDVPFKVENAFLSAAPLMDPKDPKKPQMIVPANEFEKRESPSPQGFKIAPSPAGGEYGKDVIPYLSASPEMIDSAKLRVIARMKKLSLIIQSGNQAYADFYKKIVTAPIVLFIGMNAGTGPACAPLPMHLDLKEGGHYFFNTVTFVEDIPKFFSIADAIKNDTFDMVVAHENAHAIMFDIYGPDITKIDKVSNMGHDGPMVSDRGLAYIEGWAEAFEALYGPTNPLLKLKEADREKYRISEFLFTRQDPVRRDRYIWQDHKGKKTGILKNGSQILSTEGAIAGLFYDILTSKSLKDPFGKCISVMYEKKPVDFVQFLKAWTAAFPEDKNTLYRMFLEGTNYATVSNEARKLYYDYYQAKLKFVQKQMDEKTFYDTKKKWTVYKEDLFAKAMQNESQLTSNVSRDLWTIVKGFKSFSLGGMISGILGNKGMHVNIASVTIGQLLQLREGGFLKEMTDEDIAKFVKTREQMGVMPYTSGVAALREILGKDRAEAIIKANGISDLK